MMMMMMMTPPPPVLFKLYQLSVKFFLGYEVPLLIFKVLNDLASAYTADVLKQ